MRSRALRFGLPALYLATGASWLVQAVLQAQGRPVHLMLTSLMLGNAVLWMFVLRSLARIPDRMPQAANGHSSSVPRPGSLIAAGP